MARGNQLDRQWRLLQLIRPARRRDGRGRRARPGLPRPHRLAGHRGVLVIVRMAFAKGSAPNIRERLWHPTQRLRDLPDGRLELTLGRRGQGSPRVAPPHTGLKKAGSG
jgi:hypothetical protein